MINSVLTTGKGEPPLLLKTAAACVKLGGIHPRTLARLEARGLIRSIKLLRHRLYAVKDLEAMVENLGKWGGGAKP